MRCDLIICSNHSELYVMGWLMVGYTRYHVDNLYTEGELEEPTNALEHVIVAAVEDCKKQAQQRSSATPHKNEWVAKYVNGELTQIEWKSWEYGDHGLFDQD